MTLPRLQVDTTGRFLVTESGQPFFWLADTAWELFHRLTRQEADHYLQDRAGKKFTVIQAVVLAELDGLNTPNPAGHRPLIDNDPTRPNAAYFEDVDWIVRRAGELGLYIGMLPTWGDKWHKNGGTGPLIFNHENAHLYGRFLGARYRDQAIVWILGGDKFVGDDEERRILEAMAQGLREGDAGHHLITFHPIGQYSSANYFHHAPWLDFNMIQTGHTRDRDNYTSITAEYNRTPIKPVLDGEPGYENIPHAFDDANPRLEAIHTRRFCYWALFSGACGHTYGCNDIWQMWKRGDNPIISAKLPWDEAIHLPGAGQMQYARMLIESGPYFDRIPDPSLVEPPNTTGPDYLAACRAPDARYALVYFPTGKAASLRTFLLKGPRLAVRWYDPCNGEYLQVPGVEVTPWKTTQFIPPSVNDWILVLDSIAFDAKDAQ
jgi:hypothetical protein